MQLLSKFNKTICLLLSVIDIYSKFAWIIPLKDKKGITITNAFQKILDESNRKPNKIWVDKWLLSHGAEWNMGNIFRVSHILQLISRAFRRVE